MGKQTEAILGSLSPNQRNAAEHTGSDVFVRAGAGSGKTKTLVARYLYLLDENRTWHPADITAMTFTRKAAREMQSRIREQMMDLAAANSGDPHEKQYWLQMLNEMDSANIGTIHSLCGRILRAHPAEAGLDPAFAVLDDNRAAMMRTQIVNDIITNISADPEYESLLNLLSGNKIAAILSDMLKNRGKTDKAVAVPMIKTEGFLRKHFEKFLFNSEYVNYIDSFREIVEDSGYQKKNKAFCGHLRDLINGYDEICAAVKTATHPADVIHSFNDLFSGWSISKDGDEYKYGAWKIREDLRGFYGFLKKDYKNPDRDIAWFKDFWRQCDEAEECFRKLWPETRDAYTSLLDASQMIDFDAMENLTLDLLRTHPEIRTVWTDRIKALLVDEFQDTNDSQAELFSLLNPSRDRLFAVGDKKQSIYGFRGTNVALFEQRRQDVIRSGGTDIALDMTYRTEPELLTPMGMLLERVMADSGLNTMDTYAAYEPMNPRDTSDYQPDALPKEPPYIELLIGDIREKESDPDKEIVGRMLADRLTELMTAGLLHNWNDAVILCRRSNDFKQFEKALEAWQIPYVTVAGKGYYDRPEIRDILNILRAAENPNDNATLTGFLMSPSIGFSAEMMALLYRHTNKGGLRKSFYQALSDEGFSFEDEEKQRTLERARSILRQLIRISGQVPLDESLEEACRLTGIRTMLALDTGDRAWLNIDKLIPAARESGLTSVSEFLEYLKDIEETGAREGEAPSDNNGAVRIMTIHQAKGLEFPVTIVCDDEFKQLKQPNIVENAEGAYAFYSSPAHPRFEDAKKQAEAKDKAEWLRLFYVATTRAKFRLIICGNKSVKSDSWLKRTLDSLPGECTETAESVIPAWDVQEHTIRVRCRTELPSVPEEYPKVSNSKITITGDCYLLQPIEADRTRTPRRPEHTAALTVGKMVHKGIELWCFSDENGSDPVLSDAFQRILMQSDRLTPEEQHSVIQKAEMLLGRFKGSDAFHRIESADQRWHEIPFSVSNRGYTVNGVIDLLLKDSNGYTVIDFKTDSLNSMDDLTMALEEHAKQINSYRRALNITLGIEPRCMICFLDYRGKVRLEPVGKDAADPSEYEAPELDEPILDDFGPEETMLYSDLFLPEI